MPYYYLLFIHITNNIVLTDNGGGIRLRDKNNATTLSGIISGTGNFWISYDGGVATLSGANTYTGKTIFGSNLWAWGNNSAKAVVKSGSDTALPNGTVLEFGIQHSDASLDMNGFNATVSEIATGNGVLPTTYAKPTITNSSESPSTLTVDVAQENSVTTRHINIDSKVTLQKTGAGTLTLNDVTGGGTIELNQGKTVLISDLSVSNLSVTGDAVLSSPLAGVERLWGAITIKTARLIRPFIEPI